MVLMTMIARVVDGLPLAATMQEDEQVTNTANVTVFYQIIITLLGYHVEIVCYLNFICDRQSGCNILEYQNQAKMLFRKLGPQSPIRCSIESGPFLFQ